MGAEPDRIDEGPHAGLRLFKDEEMLSLRLMQSLPAELQEKATLSKSVDGTSLPEDRWNPFDERHLGGARQDNRVVPYGKSFSQDSSKEGKWLIISTTIQKDVRYHFSPNSNASK